MLSSGCFDLPPPLDRHFEAVGVRVGGACRALLQRTLQFHRTSGLCFQVSVCCIHSQIRLTGYIEGIASTRFNNTVHETCVPYGRDIEWDIVNWLFDRLLSTGSNELYRCKTLTPMSMDQIHRRILAARLHSQALHASPRPCTLNPERKPKPLAPAGAPGPRC